MLGLAGGLAALALAVGETPAGDVLLVGAALGGAVVAAAVRPPLLLLCAVALAIGAAIGLNSPPEVISVQEGVVMLIRNGLGATIGLALLVAAAAAWRATGNIGVQVLGSWTAASALLAIAVRFARS